MPEPETPKPPFWTSPQFLVLTWTTTCILYLIVYLVVRLSNNYMLLSPIAGQRLGILGITLLITLLAFSIFQIRQRRKYPPPPETEIHDPAKIKKRIRRLRVWLVLLVSCLAYVTWGMRDDRLSSRLETTAVYVFLAVLLLNDIRILQRKLKQ